LILGFLGLGGMPFSLFKSAKMSWHSAFVMLLISSTNDFSSSGGSGTSLKNPLNKLALVKLNSPLSIFSLTAGTLRLKRMALRRR